MSKHFIIPLLCLNKQTGKKHIYVSPQRIYRLTEHSDITTTVCLLNDPDSYPILRWVKSLFCVCILTQKSSHCLPSRLPSGIIDSAPSSQWRDRTGFAPVSILASLYGKSTKQLLNFAIIYISILQHQCKYTFGINQLSQSMYF
mgnify:CR=1 FL=1